MFTVVISRLTMSKWINRKENKSDIDAYDNVIDGLKTIYKTKLLPLEQCYQFQDFHSPPLDDPDFDSKPMVLLVGQYSTGKTTFIRHTLQQDFPGLRIGPEPTTDSFTAIMHTSGPEGIIPGNALVVDPKKQFRVLSKFGNGFLNRFCCSQVNCKVLKSITFVDTPGILSGEKQRVDRGYDFTGVLEWFADRADRILLLFDAHKLDISDEFKRCIEVLRRNDDKIRIVLNKADMIDHQQLMRVYGALMWSLGKVLNTPEVARVYTGSFWDKPLHYDYNRRLFELETQDLFTDLEGLPRNATLRKLNDLIKRARLAKVHAYLVSEIRKEMPSVFGKDTKKKELIKNLKSIYDKIHLDHQISYGDFPNIERMQDLLKRYDFSKFKNFDKRLIENVERMLSHDITRLMALIPQEGNLTLGNMLVNGSRVTNQPLGSVGIGGAFDDASETPFQCGQTEGVNEGVGDSTWIIEKHREKYDKVFYELNPVNNRITGSSAKQEMLKSKLPNSVLGRIWKLADVDKDGLLDIDEWALASYLIHVKLEGNDLPTTLPVHLIPPSKQLQNGSVKAGETSQIQLNLSNA
ncbi:hypothetical protein GJ496_005705 [Pomphorhynchus laevis]|nr:hypothetical protein GJ496_005705 [Pomphorhynchus laevis]